MEDQNIRSVLDFLHKRLNFNYKMIQNDSLSTIKEKIQHCLEECDTLCENRLIMGNFRYGSIEKQNFDDYDLKEECKKRLNLNTLEGVVDAINMLRLYFYWQRKKNKEFISIDDGIHSQKVR